MRFTLRRPETGIRRLAGCLLGLALILGVNVDVTGDDIRPLYIEIQSGDSGHDVFIKAPGGLPPFNTPSLIMPRFCAEVGEQSRANRYVCSDSLAGASLGIAWSKHHVSLPTIVRWVQGNRVDTLSLRPGASTFELPLSVDSNRAFFQYVSLGIEHILIGYDHLLFLLCLVWLAGTLPNILIAVTGFTVAHSVTLALAAFDVVTLPVAWVEAVIALSVLFLAAELVRERDTLTRRFPMIVPAGFGLLHGLGFAAVLGEIGLPEDNVMSALLGFNIGVEIGQVAFILCCWAAIRAAARISALTRLPDHLARHFTAYIVGGFSGFWVIERVLAFLPGTLTV